jgi:hypothetical protein
MRHNTELAKYNVVLLQVSASSAVIPLAAIWHIYAAKTKLILERVSSSAL